MNLPTRKLRRERYSIFIIGNFFLLLGLLICFCTPGWGLTLISPAKDLRYIAQDPKVRADFLKKRQAFVQEVVKEISSLLPRVSPGERNDLKSALDMLKRLPGFWEKINTELKAHPRPLPIEVETAKSRFSVKDFHLLLDQDFQLQEEISVLGDQITFQKMELSRLEDGLNQLYFEYLNLWQTTPPGPKAYLRLAELLTLQARYALATLNFQRNIDYKTRLIKLQERLKKVLCKAFQHLIVTSADLSSLMKDIKDLKQQSDKESSLCDLQAKKLEKSLALINIKLLRAEGNSSPDKTFIQKRWEIAKERLELKLDNLAKRKQIYQLNVRYLQFFYEWLHCYKYCSGSEFKKELQILRSYFNDFSLALQEFKQSRDYLNRRLLALQSSISFHLESLQNVHGVKRTSLINLLKEEKDFVKDARDISLFYQQSIQDLRRYNHHVQLVVYLWQIKIGLFQDILTRFWQKTKEFSEQIYLVLHYPLLTVRGANFTLLALLEAVLVFILGFLSLKIIRWKIEQLLIKHFHMAPGLVNSLSTLSYYFLLVLLVLVTLSTAGVNLNQVALIFGALSVGIGFGLQTIANNFVSGIILLTERSIKVGDLIQLEDGTLGIVKKINIRSTVIRTFDALEIIVPNAEFVSQRIATWTYDDDWRRVIIPFGVAYGTDPKLVEQVALKAAQRVSFTREDASHRTLVRFVGFGDSSLNFELAVWIRQAEVRKALSDIYSDYYHSLYQSLKEAQIEIPFPQRDIHLRSVSVDIWQDLKKTKESGPNE